MDDPKALCNLYIQLVARKKVNWCSKFIKSFSDREHEVQVRSLRARVWHLQNTRSAKRVKRTKLSMIKWDHITNLDCTPLRPRNAMLRSV